MIRRCSVVALAFLVFGLRSGPLESADYWCTNCFDGISSGGGFSCAVRTDGSISCWGISVLGLTDPPVLLPSYEYAQVSAGASHACALFSCDPTPPALCPINNVVCWGSDGSGRVSDIPGDKMSQVSAGLGHSCGVRMDGSIACWGSDSNNQSTPLAPPANSFYSQVSAGGFHTCAVSTCTSVPCPPVNMSCWGSNSFGQSTVPPSSGPFTQVSAGSNFTCGIETDGSVSCWGYGVWGQTSPPAGSFLQISAGLNHACGVKADGSVACWGANDDGESTPPSGSFLQVSAGSAFSCGVRTDGSIVCWGEEANNQLWPTAGLCGLFRGGFELGGDCRWSNGSMTCWSADCDWDGYAAVDSTSYCGVSPAITPDQCPAGTWTTQPALAGNYDCQDGNDNVHSGQTLWFLEPYAPGADANADRYDYNCDGVVEKRYDSFADNVCCAWLLGECQAIMGPPGCDAPGWDSDLVSEIPECGESDRFLTCYATSVCSPTTLERNQVCR